MRAARQKSDLLQGTLDTPGSWALPPFRGSLRIPVLAVMAAGGLASLIQVAGTADRFGAVVEDGVGRTGAWPKKSIVYPQQLIELR